MEELEELILALELKVDELHKKHLEDKKFLKAMEILGTSLAEEIERGRGKINVYKTGPNGTYLAGQL